MHENRTEETIAPSLAERVTNPVVTLMRRHRGSECTLSQSEYQTEVDRNKNPIMRAVYTVYALKKKQKKLGLYFSFLNRCQIFF